MRDEGFDSPFGVLNVARDADIETVEATFARQYKAARREADGDLRRQALNRALETLRDKDKRAQAELGHFHVPLDPHRPVPTGEELARELLPLEIEATSDLGQQVRQVPAEPAADVAAELVERTAAAQWPEPRTVLMRLAARVALECSDPWHEA